MSWIAHVKAVAEEKGISFKDALKVAGDTYNKSSGKKQGKTKKTHKKSSAKKTQKKRNNEQENNNDSCVSMKDIYKLLTDIQQDMKRQKDEILREIRKKS